MVGCVVLLLIAVALAIYGSPNSYAHLFLTGRCFGDSVPDVCHPRGGRGFGARTGF